MTHGGAHYIERCKFCREIISQCRCSDPRKPTRFGICGDCAEKVAAGEDPTPVEHPGPR